MGEVQTFLLNFTANFSFLIKFILYFQDINLAEEMIRREHAVHLNSKGDVSSQVFLKYWFLELSLPF